MALLRGAYEFFSDRVNPSFRGVRRRAVGGMTAAGWRKMCKDTGLFKGGGGLAKAAVIFEEVSGKRSMDFDSFKSALNIVALRKKKTRFDDVSAFIIHVANTLRDSDSLTSAESSVRSNIQQQQQKATAAGGGGKASKIIQAAKKTKGTNNKAATKGGGASTRSIGSASSNASTIATLEEGSSTFSLPPLNNNPPKKASDAKKTTTGGGGTGGASFASFAKGNQANSEYGDKVKNSLLLINASLRERKEASEEDLAANGFSWEKKERLSTKLKEDAFAWDWGN